MANLTTTPPLNTETTTSVHNANNHVHLSENEADLALVSTFTSACVLLLLAHFLRVKIRVLRKMYLPSSLIAGLVGVTILQLGSMNEHTDHILRSHCVLGWEYLPSFLINIVFACLFLGSEIPGITWVWNISGPQLMYGQILAWGQYGVGMIVTAALLVPVYNVNTLMGAVVALGFEGGHGTAAGVRSSFISLGYPAGAELTLCAATIGLISGLLFGTMVINWAVRFKKIQRKGFKLDGDRSKSSNFDGIYLPNERPSAGLQTVSVDSLDNLAFHLSLVGLALLFAFAVKMALLAIEAKSQWLTDYKFFSAFPMFPFAMFGGIIIQKISDIFMAPGCIDRGTMERISGVALDFVVVTAISTMSFDGLRDNLAPFCILIVTTWFWHFICFFILAPRLLPDYWVERASAELGQSMGITATGLLLLRMCDPHNETPALAAFSYKQLFHAPLVAGGLWTATVLPFIKAAGLGAGITCAFTAVFLWLLMYWFHFRPKYRFMHASKSLLSDQLLGSELEVCAQGDNIFEDEFPASNKHSNYATLH
eukprot:m.120851 g.120851  ORF g.120851 m.120851 type:complete len:539 (-) comp14373_c0_seq1:1673-3289(-)